MYHYKMGKLKTIKEFVFDANSIHNNKYDYSLVEYINNKTKVKIICHDHGIFEQRPDRHLRGNGCSYCSKKKSYTTKSFIKKANSIHNNKYDYSLVEYINNKTKVKIICPIHGIFEQIPSNHINNSHGCPECSSVKPYTTKSFIEKANSIHDNQYDYSLVEYINSNTKVKIICTDHGIFEQTPQYHLYGYGCYTCTSLLTSSKQELELREYISSIYKDEIITNDRNIISPYELDIYLPDINTAFEYNGNYWHQEGINKPIGYHQMKTNMCKDKGIRLHHIWDDDWIGSNKEYIKTFITEQIVQ